MVGEVLYLALGRPAQTEQEEATNVSDGQGLEQVFEGMQERFQPDKAVGVDATIQWKIKDGDEEKPYAITIKNGSFSWAAGEGESPAVTLSTDVDSFVALMTGKAQGAALYMSGKLRIDGDLMLAQRMGTFFS